jgi:hypothetical protein
VSFCPWRAVPILRITTSCKVQFAIGQKDNFVLAHFSAWMQANQHPYEKYMKENVEASPYCTDKLLIRS